ncbi:hypothetical protein [Nitratireductor alexandrii]|uniref:hypothetical protein n=1 Tax=Nitratireductor alexandrii TaxID=2448161 RepID=UPI000FD988A2|nr:hypothetical protein [Nitratireductor alexandrii]
MDSAQLHTLSLVRNVAFAATGTVLMGFAAAVLFGALGDIRLAVWSAAAGGALFVIVFAVSALAGRKGNLVLWDEAVQADYARSQRWAYTLAIIVIFPGIAFAIFVGFDPLRGFVASALTVGAVQLLLFSVFDLIGR